MLLVFLQKTAGITVILAFYLGKSIKDVGYWINKLLVAIICTLKRQYKSANLKNATVLNTYYICTSGQLILIVWS